MTKCKGKPYASISLDSDGGSDLKRIIDANSEEFIEFIHKLGLNLESRSKTSNFEYSSFTILTLKTTCFKVDFNDNFAIISPLK